MYLYIEKMSEFDVIFFTVLATGVLMTIIYACYLNIMERLPSRRWKLTLKDFCVWTMASAIMITMAYAFFFLSKATNPLWADVVMIVLVVVELISGVLAIMSTYRWETKIMQEEIHQQAEPC